MHNILVNPWPSPNSILHGIKPLQGPLLNADAFDTLEGPNYEKQFQ